MTRFRTTPAWLPTAAALAALCACGAPPPPPPEGPPAGEPAQDAGAQPAEPASGGASCLRLQDADTLVGRAEVKGCSARRWLSLENACARAVTVDWIELQRHSGVFALVGAPAIPQGGLQLAPGESFAVSVRFSPKEEGIETAELVFHVTNPAEPERVFAVAGLGVAAALQVEGFAVPDLGDRFDLLVVVDNPPQFAEHAEAVKRNLRAVASYLARLGADARWAMTTTGGAGSALGSELLRASGEVRVLEARAVGFEARAGEMIDQLAAAASAPGALAATRRALESTAAAEFLRSDATTAILVVSPRREVSGGSVYEHVGWISVLAGEVGAQDLTISVAAGMGGSTCATQDDGRFTLAVALTGGVSLDVCAPDWAGGLEASTRHFAPFRAFLSRAVDMRRGAPSVTVDGIGVPPVGAEGEAVWSYHEPSRSIGFEPMTSPAPGARVEVSYLPVCGD